MSKTKEFTPAMLADVNTVLEMAKKNKYSVSKVYAAYNAVTGKTDPPQTCNSCVRNRVAYLRKWHAEYVELMEPDAGIQPDGFAPVGGLKINLAPTSLRLTPDQPDYKEGLPGGVFFKPNALEHVLTEDANMLAKLGTDPIGTPDEPTPPSQDERPDVIMLAVPGWESRVYFEPGDKDPLKGKAFYEGGGGYVKPGKYTLTDDRELAVQPGGKATIKAAPADNDLL